jgi:hypothetical protein
MPRWLSASVVLAGIVAAVGSFFEPQTLAQAGFMVGIGIAVLGARLFVVEKECNDLHAIARKWLEHQKGSGTAPLLPGREAGIAEPGAAADRPRD